MFNTFFIFDSSINPCATRYTYIEPSDISVLSANSLEISDIIISNLEIYDIVKQGLETSKITDTSMIFFNDNMDLTDKCFHMRMCHSPPPFTVGGSYSVFDIPF